MPSLFLFFVPKTFSQIHRTVFFENLQDKIVVFAQFIPLAQKSFNKNPTISQKIDFIFTKIFVDICLEESVQLYLVLQDKNQVDFLKKVNYTEIYQRQYKVYNLKF